MEHACVHLPDVHVSSVYKYLHVLLLCVYTHVCVHVCVHTCIVCACVYCACVCVHVCVHEGMACEQSGDIAVVMVGTNKELRPLVP